MVDQTLRGRGGRELPLTRDVGAHWIGRMVKAERRLREGLALSRGVSYRRRRDIVGKGTPVLGGSNEPNARISTSWPMLSLLGGALMEGE